MKKNKALVSSMELLAPAGSFASFAAALEEGADAIYVGAPDLNARALSRDFSYSDINALVREAHSKNVRVYIAMNSLVREDEIETAVEGLAFFDQIKPDALIIQDLGLLKLARTFFPKLSLHASTLMSVHNSLAVKKMTELGCKRIVLPRELTLQEIKDIYNKTDAELEVFVHGAMCFSYSGLCMFSSMFGGKSSLRGRCVQPCRRRYAWQRKKGYVKKGKQSEKDGGYLFSMNDLCGIDLLPQLRDAGVACLKIEGRLKSAEYVRKTVRAYRLLLDDLGENGPSRARQKEARKYLDEAMGRRRSTGFFLSGKPREAVTPNLSGNIGIPAGKVVKLEESQGKGHGRQAILTTDLIRDIRVGDRLRLHDERSGERTAFTLRTLKIGNRLVKDAKGGRKVKIVLPRQELKGRKGQFKGSLFKVDVSSARGDEHKAKTCFLKKQNKLLKRDEGKIERILQRCFNPQTQIKGSRRVQDPESRLQMWMQIRSLRDRQYRLPVSPDKYIVPLDRENVELIRRAPAKLRNRDQQIIWSLPAIIQEDKLSWYAETIHDLVSDGFESFQLGHVSQYGFFDNFSSTGTNLKLFGHYTCNVLNSMSLQLINGMQFRGIQFSLETDQENLDMATQNFRNYAQNLQSDNINTLLGMYVYGRPPLFTARLDDPRYQYGKRFVSPKKELFVLNHHEGITSARPVIPFSLIGHRKELENCGIDFIVFDLSEGNIKRNISELIALAKKHGKETEILSGNYKTGLM